MDLPHETLVWSGPKPATGLPNAARDARYRLLTERLARESAPAIALLTAHTQDDQAETMLMRLARGSGLDGLASMSRERPLGSAITLIRPLLTVPKARLEATLTALGQTWITDPTNADLAYERPRLRQSEAARNAAGMTNAALALSATRLARANAALDSATSALDAAAVTHTPAIFARLTRTTFAAAPAELRIRLLASLLRSYGGDHPPARLSEIERLNDRLAAPDATATTLGGCLITPTPDAITVYREPRSRPPRHPHHPWPISYLGRALHHLSDVRCPRSLHRPRAHPCRVASLAPPPANLTHARSSSAHRFPTIWHGARLVAAPSIARLSTQLEHGLHPTASNRPYFLADGLHIDQLRNALLRHPAAAKVCSMTQTT